MSSQSDSGSVVSSRPANGLYRWQCSASCCSRVRSRAGSARWKTGLGRLPRGPREGLPGSVPGNSERASPKGMPLRIPALAASNEQAVTYRPREDSANRMIGAGEVDRECGAGLLVFTVVSNGKASGSGGSDSSRCTGQSGYQTHITRRIIHIQLNRTTRKWTSTRQQCHTQASTSSARCD